MKTFREYLKEKSKNVEFEESFYKSLRKTRISYDIMRFREKAGMTQEHLAEKANTSQSAIARLENPNYKGYSIKTLEKIGEALNLEIVVSFTEKDSHQYRKPSTIIYKVEKEVWKDKPEKGYRIRKFAIR